MRSSICAPVGVDAPRQSVKRGPVFDSAGLWGRGGPLSVNDQTAGDVPKAAVRLVLAEPVRLGVSVAPNGLRSYLASNVEETVPLPDTGTHAAVDTIDLTFFRNRIGAAAFTKTGVAFTGIPGSSAAFYGRNERRESAVISAGFSGQLAGAISTDVNYDRRLERERKDSNTVTGGVCQLFIRSVEVTD
jgi:hypothetical protein